MSADWIIRWAVIVAIVVFDGACLWAKGIHFVGDSVVGFFITAGILLGCCVVFSLAAGWRKSLATVLTAASDFFYSLTQLLLIVPPMITLSYLAASLDLPLVDGALRRADEALFYNWPAVSAWMWSHPWLLTALTFTYMTILWQPFLVLFLNSVNRPGDNNSEFIWAFLFSATIASAISGVLPALGYEGVIGSPHIDVLREIRAGAWTTLDIHKVDGIITFPSFHSALGILFLYGTWRTRWAFWILFPLNIVLIISTPTVGGHYFVDVIAGILVAALAIVLTRRIRAWTTRQRFEWMAWLPDAFLAGAGQER
ncbi:MAG TPA: phosphatase PAP2 family protein [Stellaceae bacterium]|nr:phosphatase PAP2 family protein [Stellaceae bacterium]